MASTRLKAEVRRVRERLVELRAGRFTWDPKFNWVNPQNGCERLQFLLTVLLMLLLDLVRPAVCSCPNLEFRGHLPVANGLQNPLKSLATRVHTMDTCPDANDVWP